MIHDFAVKLEEGQEHEATLDRFFGRWFDVRPATAIQQRMGIDRVWTNVDTSAQYSVEYKADSTAAKTGNAFVEAVSVDTTGRRGWVLSSLAQVLVYYLPPTGQAYVANLVDLKRAFPDWKAKYRLKEAKNADYSTFGVCVPLGEFGAKCVRAYHVPTEGEPPV